MPLPTVEPTDLPKVRRWLNMKPEDTADDDVIGDIVESVNVFVRGLPVAQRLNTDPAPEAWPATVSLGARMLAGRLFRRKNTPGGVEVAGSFGIAYVRRNDPDIAQLLDLGEYAAPAVG